MFICCTGTACLGAFQNFVKRIFDSLYLSGSILHGISLLPMDRFLWNLIFEYFYKTPSRKLKLHQNLTRITCSLHEDQWTFHIISRSFLLRMKNIWEKFCTENHNIYCMIKRNFFFENPDDYEIMLKGIVQASRPHMKILWISIACWISNATNTHSENLTFSFPL